MDGDLSHKAQLIPAAEAARRAGFVRDYITRLCREGKLRGVLIGKNWHVDPQSLDAFLVQSRQEKEQRRARYAAALTKTQTEAETTPPRLSFPRDLEPRETFVARAVTYARETQRVAPAAMTYALLPVELPTAEFFNRIAAAALAFTLTFGTLAIVEPAYAQFAADSARHEARSITETVSHINAPALAARTQTQLAAAASNPAFAVANVEHAIAADAAIIARTFNASVDSFVYAVAFPQLRFSNDGNGAVAANIPPYQQAPLSAPTPAPTAPASTTATAISPQRPLAETITQPVIERIVQAPPQPIISAGGITQDQLTQQLQELDSKLSAQMFSLSNAQSTVVAQNYNVTAQTNAIDQLDGTTITNPTINGGSLSNFSIGATSVSTGDLTVNGDTTLNGQLSIPGALTISSSTISLLTAAYATTSFASIVDASTTNLTWINATGTNSVFTNATSTNLFATLGNFTSAIASTLSASFANITGLTATLASSTNLFAANATFGALSLNGSGYFSGGLGVGVATTSPGVLQTSGNAWIGGNLYVAGNSTTIGASSANTLAINSAIVSDLIPDQNIVRNLGSPSFFWNNAYVGTLTANNIAAASSTIEGTSASNFTINSANTSADQENSSLIFFRGTVVPNALLTWDAATSSKRFEFNQALYVANASASTTEPTFTLQSTAAQTANILQIASSSGATLASIGPDGSLSLAGNFLTLGSTTLQNFTGLNATTSDFFASTASSTNLYAASASLGAAVFGNATTTNLFAANASTTNATSTNLFSSLGNFTTELANTLTASLANISGLTATNASTSLLSVYGTASFGGSATSTFDSAGDLSVAGNTTLANATTTSLFVKSQLSASAFTAPNATIGALTATSTLAVSNTASFYGTASFGATATSTFDSAGDLSVAGNTTLSNATTTSLNVKSALTAWTASFGGTGTSTFGTNGALTLASALTVQNGGTGANTFGQGWLYSTGGTGALAASTSPTVNYVVATSTSVASQFPYASSTALTVSGNSYLGVATSTSLNANTSTIGTLSAGTLALGSTFNVAGLSTFTGGFVSQASSTVVGNFTSTGNAALGGTLTAATTTINALVVSNTSTSTFAGGVSLLALNITGSATSTAANGVNLAAGCFSINNNCLSLGNISGTLAVNQGGTGAANFAQGWLYSNGGTAALSASTSPTVNYLVATSTTVASQFPYASSTALTVSGNSYLGAATVSGTATVGNLINNGVTVNTLLYANGSKQESSVSLPAYITLTSGSLAISALPVADLAADTISGVTLGNALGTLTFGAHLAAGGSSYNGSAGVTISTDATNANTASTIVARDSSGNFSAGTITANLTGTASNVTTDANLTGPITSSGNATAIASQTGTGSTFAMSASPTFTGSINLPGSGIWNLSGNVGIGTTTPWAQLSVTSSSQQSGSTALFAVASTTGTPLFNVLGNGSVGIGTASPFEELTVLPASSTAATVSTPATGSRPLNVYVQGRYAYVVNETGNTFSIIDVSNPSSPTTMSTSATSLNPYNIYVQGHYAYITNLAGTKLSIFDVSNPAAPVTVSTPSTGGDPTGIYVQGRYAYVTSESTNSLYILDVSNPASPVTVSTLSTGSTPGAVYVQGRYAYVLNTGSTGSNGLAIIDVSNPASPVTVSTPSTGSGPQGIYVQGRYAYVVNQAGNSMSIIDVSNPASPVTVSTLSISSSPNNIYVQGRYAYVTNGTGNTLSIIDISNPASPVTVSTPSTGSDPQGVYVQGRYAYVTNYLGNTLSVIDLGGSYIQQGEFGGLEAGTLDLRDNLQAVDGEFSGGLTVGQSLQVTGSASIVSATSTIGTTANIFNIATASSTNSILSVLGNGNVGIGTTNPGALLQVNGTRNAPGSGALNGIFRITNTADTGIAEMGISSSGAGFWIQSRDSNTGSPTNYPLMLNPLGGNVGIGTTNPGTKFQVGTRNAGTIGTLADFSGSAATNMVTISSSNSSADYPKLELGASDSGYGILQAHLDVTGATTLALNPSGGNVGIGTTTPGSLLTVAGTIASVRNNGGNGLQYWDSESGFLGWYISSQSGQLNFNWTDNTGTYQGTYMTLNSSGQSDFRTNVGIGTTSPATTLSVSGSGYLTGGLGVGVENTTAGTLQTSGNAYIGGGAGTVTANLTVTGSNGNYLLDLEDPANRSWYLQPSGQALTWTTNDATNIFTMRGDSGNVGIGTTTPNMKLQVYGGDGVANFSVSGATNMLRVVPQSTEMTLEAVNAAQSATVPLVLQASGNNVGIGTTTPGSILNAYGGAISANGSGSAPSATEGPAISMYEGGGTGIIDSLDNTVAWEPLQMEANTFSFISGASTQGFYQNSSGQVGIGTTNPGAPLSIQGGTQTQIQLGQLSGLPTYNAISLNADLSATGGMIGMFGGGGSGDANLYLNAGSGGLLVFRVNGNTSPQSLVVSASTATFATGVNPASTNTYNLGASGSNWGCLYYNNSTLGTCASDENIKKDITDYGDGLSELTGLNPVLFRYDTQSETDPYQIGLIAQQVQTVAPDLVGTTTYNGATVLDVNYSDLTYMAINSIKQLNDVFNATNASTSQPTIQSYFAGTSTPAISVDAAGDVSIGTSTTDQAFCLNGSCITSLPFGTSTASSSPSFSSDFLNALEQTLTHWLGNTGNGIANLFAKNVYASNGTFTDLTASSTVSTTITATQQLCVNTSGGAAVCITGDQLAALLSAAASPSPESVTSSGGSSVQNSSPTSPESVTSTSTPDTPPDIQVNGDNPAIVQVGAAYNDLGATITGPSADLNLGIMTYLNGTLAEPLTIDTTQPATDTIQYVATDQSGLAATSTRTVIIQAPAGQGSASSSDTATSSSSDASSTPN